MNRFFENPVFIALAAIGIMDMFVQAATSGEVKLIQFFLHAIFG